MCIGQKPIFIPDSASSASRLCFSSRAFDDVMGICSHKQVRDLHAIVKQLRGILQSVEPHVPVDRRSLLLLFSKDYGGFENTHLNCLNVVELSEPGSKYGKLSVVLAKLAKAQSYEVIENGSLSSIPVYRVLSTPPVTFVNPPGTDNVGTQV